VLSTYFLSHANQKNALQAPCFSSEQALKASSSGPHRNLLIVKYCILISFFDLTALTWSYLFASHLFCKVCEVTRECLHISMPTSHVPNHSFTILNITLLFKVLQITIYCDFIPQYPVILKKPHCNLLMILQVQYGTHIARSCSWEQPHQKRGSLSSAASYVQCPVWARNLSSSDFPPCRLSFRREGGVRGGFFF